jgi:hypothetical protein
MKGRMMFKPGFRTLWKRPKRSITRVSDCGTTLMLFEAVTNANRISKTAKIIVMLMTICFYVYLLDSKGIALAVG